MKGGTTGKGTTKTRRHEGVTFHFVLNYYADTDSLYIDLIDSPAADSQEVRPGVVLDFDAQGRLVGIDIDHASKHAALDTLHVDELPIQQTVLG